MTDNRRYKTFTLKNMQAPNFLMTPLELKDFITFDVKRVYFICKPQGPKNTGAHCHVAEEDELFVMMAGSCTAVVDDGHGLEEIKMVGPKDAMFVPKLVWHHFKDLSDDAILVAITSTNYNPNRADYCEDYEAFKKLLIDKGVTV
jgi:mannose-6-phosphate isomerase-like protein (cupin superfamily)